MRAIDDTEYRRAKRRIFDIIQISNTSDTPSRAFDIFLVAVIVCNILVMFFETFQALSPYYWLLGAVDDWHNGLTFCAGSLSSGAHNDVVAMAREVAPRTHFVHLRSCDVLPGGDFVEAPHTAGRADLVELVRIFEREGRDLPMRVDHGKTMLGDEKLGYNPGYSFHGRMLALGQVEGMMAAVRKENL